ncbi:hypothetical protein F66182_10400 [Fusarium sp. NRRL 66182]|nr:hypothetical protein F66182_10400 [Fusarium sp. NRRL 66182]
MNPVPKNALWNPQNVAGTNTAKFISHVNEKRGLQLQTYHDLYQWSVGQKTFQDFWTDAYNWLRLSPGDSKRDDESLQGSGDLLSLMFPPPKFFPNSTLSIAEIILRGRKDKDLAISFSREKASDIERVTWGTLKERIRKLRSALISSGVKSGDVVAAVISNSVDAIAICLATLSLGAVWSSTSCDMGTGGIIDRYAQVHPKVMFADQGYVCAGKANDLTDRITHWSQELRTKSHKLTQIVLIPNNKLDITSSSHVANTCTMEKFLKGDRGDPLLFQLVPFSHPAFILFSSGTSTQWEYVYPDEDLEYLDADDMALKGVALKTQVDAVIQHDVRTTDVVFQYTTTSWIMWVLNLMNLSCSAAMLLYDGSPFHPRPTILLELMQTAGVSVFGTSPRYLQTLKSHGIVPRLEFDLGKLRIMLSTGSVLSTELYEWFYSTAFPLSAQLISMSGGNDIAGSFVCGTPMLPVHAGEIQCKALGMAVDVYDSGKNESLSVEKSGVPGELVCKLPFPSQPLTFLGHDGAQRYKASYFERYGPSVWCQGDFVQDGVLNPSGVRFGSAEIYAVIENIPEILDSICVGQKRDVDSDERVLLFVKMKPGHSLTSDLERRIKVAIRDRYSPRHVPAGIFEVDDIPYTINGKKCEINVKHAINGKVFAVAATVANPSALKAFKKYRDLAPEKPKLMNGLSKL